MIGQLGHLSNSFLLLAATLLPIQQSLAATCCCQQGREAARAQVSTVPLAASLQSQDEHCNRVFQADGSCCCAGGESGSGSNPCHCPVGCCGKLGPASAAADTAGPSLTDDLAGGAVACVGTEHTAFATTQPLAISGGPSSPGGAGLCAQLCRYLL